MRFASKVGLVTGAGSGIGRAAALALSAEGAALVLCGRRLPLLSAVREQCVTAGARAIAVPTDVRDVDAVTDLFDRAERELGRVDTVVLSHGINRVATLDSIDLDLWNDVVGTNLTGSFVVARESAIRMRRAGGGRIVFVSSVSGRPGFRKFPGFSAYSASKYGLTGLAEVLAAELDGTGVGVSVLCPGSVDTEMFRRTFPGQRAEITLARAAEAILELADPASKVAPLRIVDLV